MRKAFAICQWTAVMGLFCFFACERNIDWVPEDPDTNSEYSENEDDYQWDSLSATRINLNGESIEIIGDGAGLSGAQVTVQQGGTFWLKGTLSNGQIMVQASKEDLVKLIFDNVNITCSDNPAIYIEQSGKTILILSEHSNNSIQDGTTHTTDEANAAIFSKSDMAISGNGKLFIDGNYKDAIVSKDGLIIHSGEYHFTAVDDGIRGKDYLLINDGVFYIDTGGDAIKSDNEDEGFGFIQIENGKFTIESSGKALKACNLLQIENGDFIIESIDDALHSDKDLLISKGNFTITTEDDGFHAENILTIAYADILIRESYEGIEAKTLTIQDGHIRLTSSDDGLNTVSGAGTMQFGPPGSGSGDNNLFIEGGTIVVYAGGDGIDINGSVQMTGGTIIVHGPTRNDNGAIDYDGSYTMNGGLLVAAGSSGMAQIPGSSSTQKSVLVNFASALPANTLFNLQDEDGKNIVTFRPSKSYQSVALSSPEFVSGATYMIYYNGSTTGTETDGLYSEGIYSPGTLYKSFTINSTTTTIGNSGGPGRF
ncbi:MAG: carbohydrate-binding domain-containing protein [Bacteroidota bacterium]